MLAAAILNDEDHQTFLFMFAGVFLHEIGHVFVTYLTEGRDNSPTETGMMEETKGESGRFLEQLVFGSVLNFYQHPIVGTDNFRVCLTPTALVQGQPFEIWADMYSSVARLT